MLKVWGRADSSNVQAVMRCIGELGLNYERLDFGHRFGGTDSEAFGELNPNRTIPIIQEENGDPIWESGAILRYLARQYGSDVFWPTESSKRTLVDKWRKIAGDHVNAKRRERAQKHG